MYASQIVGHSILLLNEKTTPCSKSPSLIDGSNLEAASISFTNGATLSNANFLAVKNNLKQLSNFTFKALLIKALFPMFKAQIL